MELPTNMSKKPVWVIPLNAISLLIFTWYKLEKVPIKIDIIEQVTNRDSHHITFKFIMLVVKLISTKVNVIFGMIANNNVTGVGDPS